MTGAEYIKHRIETGDRFLVNLHQDDRDLLAIILEQYAALRQPLVSGRSELLATHECKFYVNAEWTKLKCECGKEQLPSGYYL